MIFNCVMLRSRVVRLTPSLQDRRFEILIRSLKDVSGALPPQLQPLAATETPMWTSWATRSFTLSLLLAGSGLFALLKLPPKPSSTKPEAVKEEYERNLEGILEMVFATQITCLLFFSLGMITCVTRPNNSGPNQILWGLHLTLVALTSLHLRAKYREVFPQQIGRPEPAATPACN